MSAYEYASDCFIAFPCIREACVQISVLMNQDVFLPISQFHAAYYLKLGHNRFLPYPFQFIIFCGLFYDADDMNLLRDNVDTTKKNT
jgi:hypothetical protein